MKIINLIKLLSLLIISININAQNISKFNLLIGANISNPNQLIEGSESIDDYKMIKPFGNMFACLSYKNKYMIGVGKELNEYTFYSKYPKDFYVFIRVVFLKDTLKLRPYCELSYILNTYGNNGDYYKNQNSYSYGIGFIYKINRIIDLDLNAGMLHREIELESKSVWVGEKKSINADRFMIRTGLIFKIL